MLTFFPAPYPNEWWYSVLCRYHVWSGRQTSATTFSELYGSRSIYVGLFPGRDCLIVLKQIPKGVLNRKTILLEHTLLPYYLRFLPVDKKRAALKNVLSGQSIGIKKNQIQTPEGKQGLKFCPLCYAEDLERYGEPYWHREHQIPLMPVCPRHGCQLHLVEISLSKLGKSFLPLCTIINIDAQIQVCAHPTWQQPLTNALFSILTLPFEAGPPKGCNHLEHALQSAGLISQTVRNSSDIEKLRERCFEFYGQAIYKMYFSRLSPATVWHIRTWRLASPERYALLTVLAGLTVERLFAPEIS